MDQNTTPSGYSQQPQYPPAPQQGGGAPQPPASRMPRLTRNQWIGAAAIILVIACCACGGISAAMNNNSSQSASGATNSAKTQQATNTPAPTPTNTRVPTWTTIQTFTGNGIKTTPTFTVSDNWRIVWSCTPSSFYGGQYNVIVTVYGSDGSMEDLAVNTICKSGNTGDYTEEHSGGQVYLNINSEGAWKIQIQQLQ